MTDLRSPPEDDPATAPPPDPAAVKRALARLARAAGPDPPDTTPAPTATVAPTSDGEAPCEGTSGAAPGEEPGDHDPTARLVARADAAVSDLTLAVAFVEEGGLAALRRACGGEEDDGECGDPDRRTRGRAALAAFDAFRRAARPDDRTDGP